MRAILLAMLVAAGVGLSAPAKVSAAPISGLAIGGAATVVDTVQQAQHTRWRSHRRWGSRVHTRTRSHWRWGSRAHSRWRSHRRWGSRGRLCHTRPWSRWRRC